MAIDTKPSTAQPEQLVEQLDTPLDVSSIDDPSIALSSILPDSISAMSRMSSDTRSLLSSV